MSRDDNKEAGVANTDVRAEEHEDDGLQATQSDLRSENQKRDADQLTDRRERKSPSRIKKKTLGQPINSIGSANPRYGQHSPRRRS